MGLLASVLSLIFMKILPIVTALLGKVSTVAEPSRGRRGSMTRTLAWLSHSSAGPSAHSSALAPQVPLDTRLKPVLGAFVLTPVLYFNPQVMGLGVWAIKTSFTGGGCCSSR